MRSKISANIVRKSLHPSALRVASGSLDAQSPDVHPQHRFAPAWVELISEAKDLSAAKTLSDIIALYVRSRSFSGLAETSKASYGWLLERIDARFGHLPIEAFDQKGARTTIRQWRDTLMSHPTSADRTIGVFRLVLNFAVDEEYIVKNPLAGIGAVHKSTRRDILWSDEQIALFLERAPRHLARVLLLAIWTGQRQSDLLWLRWADYDGQYIRLQQRKLGRGSRGRRVKILVSKELRDVLAEIEAEQIYRSEHQDSKKRVPRPDVILTTARGKPWRLGFKTAWRRAVADAGITGVTFHDLRGTFITLAHRAGSSLRDISEASGHDEKECERVIRHHYLATGAEAVIGKLELSKRFVTTNWRMAERAAHGRPVHKFTGPRRPRQGSKIQYS